MTTTEAVGYTCISNSPCIPGTAGYYPHVNIHKFIQCDHAGNCYERDCNPNTKWVQSQLNCDWV